ncbi:MAG: carboxy terminal-processing peptidase [Verrucomicrobiota bacterium]|nr:carboxy terminal-processing peptidase [Verrucomicrobiota bacterium]
MKFFATLCLATSFLSSFAVETNFKEVFTPEQSGRVAQYVGKILEQVHFRQAPLDDKISEVFLKNYLNTLDYNHLIFLQSDVDEFNARFGKRLDDATLLGNVGPGYEIFSKYLTRLAERRSYVEKIVKEPMDFTTDESFQVNRTKLPWPANDAEAEKLWRLRIKYELLQGKLAKEKPEETIGMVTRRYQRLERTMKEFDSEEILQTYLTSLAHAYDPHSDYLSPTEAANFDINNISLSLSGIGAQLQWEDGYTKIKSLLPGGPAELSKLLKPGDKIIAVAQADGEPVDTIEMRLNKVVSMIRGKRGTEVRLTIIPASAPDTKKVISLVRDEVKLKEQFAKARIIDHVDGNGKIVRIGVIDLPQFYDNCASHVEKLLTRLKKEQVEGVVLDLRHNGGGILEEAVSLTGLFMSRGPVVQVKNSQQETEVLDDKNSKTVYRGPLIVLVGKLSASASEITAAALQDYGRALIVGDQTTHGKGTVQRIISLENIIKDAGFPNPGQLKLTVSKFYRIAGGTTQKHGVTPDIILPSLWDYLEIGEGSLENALPADSIRPATYKVQNQVKPHVETLRKLSRDRMGQSKDFAYLLEDIEEVKQRQEDKTISLNEAKRIAEKQQQKERKEARKKERASRPAPPEKAYEVDLDLVDQNKPLTLSTGTKPEEKGPAAVALNPDGEPEEEPEETAPAYDAQLNEAIAILTDYTGLLAQVKTDSTVATKTN